MFHPRILRALHLALWVAYAAVAVLVYPSVMALLAASSTALLGHIYLDLRGRLLLAERDYAELATAILALPPAPRPEKTLAAR
jgi:hypothetical protein